MPTRRRADADALLACGLQVHGPWSVRHAGGRCVWGVRPVSGCTTLACIPALVNCPLARAAGIAYKQPEDAAKEGCRWPQN